jgi:hypothetical protein
MVDCLQVSEKKGEIFGNAMGDVTRFWYSSYCIRYSNGRRDQAEDMTTLHVEDQILQEHLQAIVTDFNAQSARY